MRIVSSSENINTDADKDSIDVFHEGERSIHRNLGIDERVGMLGQRMIRDYMPEQHRLFFNQLDSIHIGLVDHSGHPWATLRTGEPGFIQSPTNQSLTITSQPLRGEPDNLQWQPGAKISLVGLEFSTRRRNRVNATVTSVAGDEMVLQVDQSYGNCPKYIQQREVTQKRIETDPNQADTGTLVTKQTANKLNLDDQNLLSAADTLFIASRAPTLDHDARAGVDINHRGGLPGFVTVLDENTLQIPDYKGNNFFNTLGNIALDPRVGVQVIDFETGLTLNLQGLAKIVTSDADTKQQKHETDRQVIISVKSVSRAELAIPNQFTPPEYSPHLYQPQT